MTRIDGFLLSLLAVLCVLMTWHYAVYRIGPDDDILWLMQSSADLFSPPEIVGKLYDEYREFLRNAGADNLWFVRADTREQLGQSQNYLASSLWMNATQRLVEVWPGGTLDARLATAMLIGFPSQTLLLCAGAVVLFCRSRLPNVLAILALALSALVLLDLIGDLVGRTPDQDLVSQSMMSSPVRFVINFIQSLVDPTPAFTLFYPTPKNQAQWLLLLAVWLRWNGRYATFYAIILAGAAFHQDYMGLFVIAFIAIDLMLRPHVMNGRVAAVALAGLLLYLVRGSLVWTALGGFSPTTILMVAAGLLALFGCAWLVGRIFLRSLGRFPATRPLSVGTDLAAIGGGWLVSLVLFIPINLAIDPIASSLFWGNVHGRLYGMFYPAAVLGLTILVVDMASASQARSKIKLAATLAVSATLAIALLAYVPGLIGPAELHARIVADLSELSEVKLESLHPGGRAETVFYYDALRRLDADPPGTMAQ